MFLSKDPSKQQFPRSTGSTLHVEHSETLELLAAGCSGGKNDIYSSIWTSPWKKKILIAIKYKYIASGTGNP